ncbi:hypothetical protein MRY82_04360 [bacterium]|nr:hypothetical protein [bacterium]
MKNLNLMHLIALIMFAITLNVYGQEPDFKQVDADVETYHVGLEYNVSYLKTAQQNYVFAVRCSNETEKCSLHFKITDNKGQLLFDILFADQNEPMLNSLDLFSDQTGHRLEEVLPEISSCKELDTLFASMYNSYLRFSEDIKFDEASNSYEGFEYHHATPLVFLTKSVLQLSLRLKEKADGSIDDCQREHQLGDVPVLFWNMEMCPIAKISNALATLRGASSLLGIEYQMACAKNYNGTSTSRPMLMGDDGREVYPASSSGGCGGYSIGHKLRQYANLYESAQKQYQEAWYSK